MKSLLNPFHFQCMSLSSDVLEHKCILFSFYLSLILYLLIFFSGEKKEEKLQYPFFMKEKQAAKRRK
jgi:hypothetical protein